MFKRLFALLALSLAANSLPAQSVVLPKDVTAVPGQWIIIAPVKVDGGAPKYRFDKNLVEQDISALFGEEVSAKRKGVVVSGVIPGKYKAEAWNAKGDVPSDIATMWITIVGNGPQPDPTPIPPAPGPTPPGPVPPGPVPPGPGPQPDPTVEADFIVGVTDNTARTLEQAGILMDGELYAWLQSKHIKFRVVDKDAPEYAAERYAADLVAAKVSPPAAIRYKGGKVISAVPAAKVPTSDAVKAFIIGKLADEKIGYDVHADSLYYKQNDEKRFLTRLAPDKAKLVPLHKAVRWSDVKTVIPRSQWKEIDRRDFFPAANWILDQDGIGSCVGNGSTNALRKIRMMSGMTDFKLSPGCTYAQINGNSDNGAVIGDSMTALMQTGTVLYSTVGETPFYLRQMPHGWQQEAARFRIAEAYVTPTFDEMMSALQLGYIIVYGMQVGNNFENFTSEGVAGIARGPGNHCMHADGCKKLANGQWAFDNANSWGATWGPSRNGRCYLVEGHFSGADTRDAYAIKAATLDPQETNKPKVGPDVPLPPEVKPQQDTKADTKAVDPFAPDNTFTMPARTGSGASSPALSAPPAGYRWVCNGRQCVLVPIR